eukprot:SAG31_NODE_10880_length_1088_cov_1.015167_2_plen_92_part_01
MDGEISQQSNAAGDEGVVDTVGHPLSEQRNFRSLVQCELDKKSATTIFEWPALATRKWYCFGLYRRAWCRAVKTATAASAAPQASNRGWEAG